MKSAIRDNPSIERKHIVSTLKRALLTRDEWLRLAADGAQLGLWYWNEVTQRLFWDRKIRRMFGVNLSGAVTLDTFFRAVHPDDLANVRAVWRHALETGRPYELEYRALRPDGSVRWIDARGSGFYSKAGKPLYMIGIVVDTTDRKRIEQERLELSGRLIHGQEQERRRFAREIHDDFCQRLAIMTVQLQTMRKALKDADAALQMEEVIAAFAGLGKDLQGLSHQLHSPQFDVLGLVPSIAALCADVAEQHRVEIEFDHGERSPTLAGDAALSLYRIAQEALHNVVKHSGASAVTMRLDANPDGVSLTVADNGKGLDPESPSNGIGVLSMKERARMLGGTCDIQSGPRTNGTTITVTLPSTLPPLMPSLEGGQ